MASAGTPSESTPLVHSQSTPTRAPRTVTFSPNVRSRSPPSESSLRPSTQLPPLLPGHLATHHQQAPLAQQGGAPVLSSINSKLRRRSSAGAPALIAPPLPTSKIGPQRSSRTAQKLKLLPNPEEAAEGPDEESGRDVYAQYTRIKDPSSRRDAARLGKADRETLPRVTAYCTAASYRMDELIRFLKGKAKARKTLPKLFDECIYSPYEYAKPKPDGSQPAPDAMPPAAQESSTLRERRMSDRRHSDSILHEDTQPDQRTGTLIDLGTEGGASATRSPRLGPTAMMRPDPQDFDTEVHIPEVFLFNYGTVVIWGMTPNQERRFLREISKFENEKLGKDDIETEEFNFYYTREYQARIYNDFISLREKKNYMTKLAISHALAQSVKTSLYEDLVDNTIESTKEIPTQIASTGKVNLTRKQINMQIGELFILRINIHLQGSVLDAPELMWAEPQLDPVYQAVRSYLEMDQRVKLLTERLDVIADLLAVLKDQLTATHGEYLEYIVIVLIAAEIVVAAVNIFVDLWAGVD